MVETNIKIKAEEKFPAGIHVKEIEGGNDDIPKEKSSSARGNDWYEYEGRSDEVTRNNEMEQQTQRFLPTTTSNFGQELAKGSC